MMMAVTTCAWKTATGHKNIGSNIQLETKQQQQQQKGEKEEPLLILANTYL